MGWGGGGEGRRNEKRGLISDETGDWKMKTGKWRIQKSARSEQLVLASGSRGDLDVLLTSRWRRQVKGK